MGFALSPSYLNALKYTGDQFPDVPCTDQPRAPTITDRNWPIFTLWRNGNKTPTFPEVTGEMWYLARFDPLLAPSLPNAIWLKVATVAVPGGTAIDQITVDAFTGPGTNPVVGDINGNVNVTGGQVATGTIGANVIRTNSLAANTYTTQIQRSTAVAATDSTKNGVAHFDSARFTSDSSAFISLNGAGVGQTITGDSGGALNPTAGNWNILGRSGSKTAGSVSTLTVRTPPYANVGAPTTVTLNSGTFVTAATTVTLPLSAGLADGDLIEIVCTVAGPIVIQANGTQVINIGDVFSSAGGTATNSASGDVLIMRYQVLTDDWWTTSSIGTWTCA